MDSGLSASNSYDLYKTTKKIIIYWGLESVYFCETLSLQSHESPESLCFDNNLILWLRFFSGNNYKILFFGIFVIRDLCTVLICLLLTCQLYICQRYVGKHPPPTTTTTTTTTTIGLDCVCDYLFEEVCICTEVGILLH
jgi:hypothetical protein